MTADHTGQCGRRFAHQIVERYTAKIVPQVLFNKFYFGATHAVLERGDHLIEQRLFLVNFSGSHGGSLFFALRRMAVFDYSFHSQLNPHVFSSPAECY